jgi:hypothetical protein
MSEQSPALQPTQPATLPPTKEAELSEFVPSIKVKGPDKKSFIVPVNRAANKAHSQLIVSRLRSIMERRLDEIEQSGEAVGTMEIGRLASAAEAIENMAERAYGSGKGINASSEFEDYAARTVKAVAAGFAMGNMNFQDRLAKMVKLGKLKQAEPTQKPRDTQPVIEMDAEAIDSPAEQPK